MAKIKSAHQQKRYLQIGFAVVFVVSFGVILAERSRVEADARRPVKDLPLAEYVRGDAIEARPGIRDYRAIAIGSLGIINQAITALENKETISAADMENAYQSLLGAPVPPMYRSMHAQLISLAKEAKKGDLSDPGELARMRARLYQSYPWLP